MICKKNLLNAGISLNVIWRSSDNRVVEVDLRGMLGLWSYVKKKIKLK